MKKVLILAYDFGPLNSIGAQRPLGWFKYFKEFGLHPVVVTRHWDAINEPNDLVRPSLNQQVVKEETELGTIVRVPYQPNLRDRILLKHGMHKRVLIRKLLSLFYSVGQYYWMRLDNRSNIYHEARKCLINSKYDVIIATGEPFILFRYADLLSKEFGIPWIADYRDGWSQNYATLHASGKLQTWLNNTFFSKIEKRIVRNARLCTFTVESHQKEVENLIPGIRSEIVMNGFFEELIQQLPAIDRPERPFVIAYSGTIYPYQELEVFLTGLKIAIEKNDLNPHDIQLVFYGLEYQPEQLNRVIGYSEMLRPFIRTTRKMPMKDVLLELNKANALLLLASPNQQQIYAKVFDYIALKRPIILCKSDNGPLQKMVLDTVLPMICNSESEVSDAISKLKDHPVSNDNHSLSSEKYSRRHQAFVLAAIIKTLEK